VLIDNIISLRFLQVLSVTVNRETHYTHLGHVISANMNDRHDIMCRRYLVCGKLNNLLCYFWKCDPFVKLRLLRNFCCDFYSSSLWDLSHSSIEELGTAWRKGLRRLLGLPYRMHNVMLAPFCSMLPLDYELMCCCAKFMNNCLISGNDVVSYVARHGIFFQRMSSPIGRNAQRCCETVGLSLCDLHAFNKQLVFQVVYSSLPDWVMPAVSVVLDLIQIR